MLDDPRDPVRPDVAPEDASQSCVSYDAFVLVDLPLRPVHVDSPLSPPDPSASSVDVVLPTVDIELSPRDVLRELYCEKRPLSDEVSSPSVESRSNWLSKSSRIPSACSGDKQGCCARRLS